MVKNLPCNAGDTGLIPGQGNPVCRGATKPVTTTTESVFHEHQENRALVEATWIKQDLLIYMPVIKTDRQSGIENSSAILKT